MNRIIKEPLGDKITVLDILYYRKFMHGRFGESFDKDVAMVIYKDENGKKKVSSIINPDLDIYITKPEYRHEWSLPREHIEDYKVYPVTCKYSHILSTIYKEMKTCSDKRSKTLTNLYARASEIRDNRSKKEIHKWQHVFMSDLPLEDYYRIKLAIDYNTNFSHKINRAFLDIESDIYGLSTTEIEMNLDKTSLVNIIFDPVKDEKRPQFHSFILKDYNKFPHQKDILNNLDEFKKVVHDEFDEITITRKGKKIKIENMIDYHFHVYENDGKLIEDVFKLINSRRPDTLGVWNIAYDYPKMRARLEMNDIDHIDAMSDTAFPENVRFVEMNIDNRPGIGPENKKTYIRMTSTTKPYCQMNLYAGVRKGGKDYGSNALDNIVERELGLRKREFQKGVSIINAAVKDYKNFLLYGINDVVLQKILDDVTNDTLSFVIDANSAASAMENVFKQTRYLKTIYYTEKIRKGFISGNNVNTDNLNGMNDEIYEAITEIEEAKEQFTPEDDDEYEKNDILEKVADVVIDYCNDGIDKELNVKGAIVGDPDLKTANGIELIEGIPSCHVFDYVADSDYVSQYPRAKISRNIGRSTQHGRVIIQKRISKRQNEYNDPQYLPGGEFVSDYVSDDILSFGTVWFNLPDINSMLERIDEELI